MKQPITLLSREEGKVGRKRPNYLFLTSIVVVALLLFATSLYVNREVSNEYLAHKNIIQNVESLISLSHLVLEEILSGDRDGDFMMKWQFLESAKSGTELLLNGGKFGGNLIGPIKDSLLRIDVKLANIRLSEMKLLTQKRYNYAKNGEGWLVSDNEYHAVYSELMGLAGHVERQIDEMIYYNLALFRNIQFALGALFLMILIVVTYQWHRHEREQAITLTSLERAKNQLRASNEDLESRVAKRTDALTRINQQLQQEIKKRSESDERATKQGNRFQALVENIELGITRIDLNLNIVMANSAMGRIIGCPTEELIGQKCFSVFRKRDGLCPDCPGMKAMTYRRPAEAEIDIISNDNKNHPCQISSFPSLDNKGMIDGFVMVMKNMSDMKEACLRLEEVNQELLVKENALEEKSVVLNGILGQVENDKNRLKSQINSNMEKIVVPILHILRERVDHQNQNFISLLDSCIKDITSPFINRLESNYNRLSLREIEICNMVKNGLSTKDIARTLSTSTETVRKQRLQVRKKLGLTGKDVNLAGFLRNL